jgi:hypothetical protein
LKEVSKAKDQLWHVSLICEQGAYCWIEKKEFPFFEISKIIVYFNIFSVCFCIKLLFTLGVFRLPASLLVVEVFVVKTDANIIKPTSFLQA